MLLFLNREMHRILKPDGMALIGSWHTLPLHDIGVAIAKFYKSPQNTQLDRILSLSDRTLLTKVNFFADVCINLINFNYRK